MHKYIVKHPGHAPEVIEVEKIGLSDLQHHVEGLITMPWWPGDEKGIDLIGNDEAILMRMPPHLGYMCGDEPMIIFGPVVFVGHDDEGETIGLTDDQIEETKILLSKASEDVGPMILKIKLGMA